MVPAAPRASSAYADTPPSPPYTVSPGARASRRLIFGGVGASSSLTATAPLRRRHSTSTDTDSVTPVAAGSSCSSTGSGQDAATAGKNPAPASPSRASGGAATIAPTAPCSRALSALRTTRAGVAAEHPTANGTVPPVPAATAPSTTSRSASSREVPSPMTPSTVIPSTPQPTAVRTACSSAGPSTRPSGVNAVGAIHQVPPVSGPASGVGRVSRSPASVTSVPPRRVVAVAQRSPGGEPAQVVDEQVDDGLVLLRQRRGRVG